MAARSRTADRRIAPAEAAPGRRPDRAADGRPPLGPVLPAKSVPAYFSRICARARRPAGPRDGCIIGRETAGSGPRPSARRLTQISRVRGGRRAVAPLRSCGGPPRRGSAARPRFAMRRASSVRPGTGFPAPCRGGRVRANARRRWRTESCRLMRRTRPGTSPRA